MADVTARKRKAVAEKDDLENQSDDEKKLKKPPQRSVLKVVVSVVGVLFLLFCLYLVIVSSPINPVVMKPAGSLPYFDGVMVENTRLQNINKIAKGKLIGPESIQMDRNGVLYTGLHDGRIVKITKSGEVIDVVRTGQNLPNCGHPSVEEKCGRPFGIHFDKKEENLIICDGYLGLLNLDMATLELTTLIATSTGVEGLPFKFLNHLTVSSDDKVYFTDSSWRWSRRELSYMILEGGGQGRLMVYDMQTKTSEVLLGGLFYANGVALSPDEDFLVVSETTANRVVRYYLKGERKDSYDLFHDNLPGYPDNIQASKEGGYWVAMSSVRKWPFNFLDFVGPYPMLKSILAKIIPRSGFDRLLQPYGLLIKLDYYGDIIASYHDPTGDVMSFVSEACEDLDEGVLYIASFERNFIGKLNLDKDGL